MSEQGKAIAMDTKKIKLKCCAIINPTDDDCESLPAAYLIPDGFEIVSLHPFDIDIDTLEVSEVIEIVKAGEDRSDRVNELFNIAPNLNPYSDIVYLILHYPEFEGCNENGIPCYAVVRGK